MWKNSFPIDKFPLFYWWNNKFFDNIKELSEYIQIRIKLREGIIEYSDLLTEIEKICQKFGEVQFSEKYKSSEKVEIDQNLVELEKIQDLLNLFDEFIDLLKNYSE
jgi:predicted nuclease with TOPRIM domain